MTVPTFLGIGAARSGTTWLYRMLASHPEVFLPEQAKELHYFDRVVLHQGWEWYLAQFRAGAAHRARGEITPDYARLTPAAVNAIAELLPGLRVIFLLRNPVDRTISQLHNFTTQRYRHASTGRLVRTAVERRSARLRNDYARTIRVWSDALGPEAVQIVLYDELVNDPRGAFALVARHLGVDDSFPLPDEVITTRVSVRPDRASNLRDEELIRWYLARMWLEPVRRLDQQLGGRVHHWVAQLEGALEAPVGWRAWRQLRRWVLFPPWDLVYRLYDAQRTLRVTRAVVELSRRHAGSSPVDSG